MRRRVWSRPQQLPPSPSSFRPRHCSGVKNDKMSDYQLVNSRKMLLTRFSHKKHPQLISPIQNTSATDFFHSKTFGTHFFHTKTPATHYSHTKTSHHISPIHKKPATHYFSHTKTPETHFSHTNTPATHFSHTKTPAAHCLHTKRNKTTEENNQV